MNERSRLMKTNKFGSGAVRSLSATVVSLALIWPSIACADALLRLKEFAASTTVAKGEFIQKMQKNSAGGVETSSGVFAFARPGKFRWDVKKPFEQLMVADGEKLFFYDKDLNQVTVKKLQDAVGASPAMLLFGGSDLEKYFNLKPLPSKDDVEWLEALPKSKEAGFDRIILGFRGGLPAQMEVRDAFNRLTSFTFTGIERNPKLDTEMFRFVAPKGADVISQ
jgi:outer membrane lipoprotein carrier protein